MYKNTKCRCFLDGLCNSLTFKKKNEQRYDIPTVFCVFKFFGITDRRLINAQYFYTTNTLKQKYVIYTHTRSHWKHFRLFGVMETWHRSLWMKLETLFQGNKCRNCFFFTRALSMNFVTSLENVCDCLTDSN